jgi:hypothetical protein
MKFKAEKDLVILLKQSIRDLFRDDSTEIFEEVSLGYGIADVVISKLISSKDKITFTPKLTLNLFDINIYNIIYNYNRVTYALILNITRSSRKDILTSLDKLIYNNYITNFNGFYLIDKGYEFPFSLNIAIEAKLKDWKRALKQAYRYKWFADYSYVVMDKYYLSAAMKNIESYRRYNVGLASITVDGKVERHFDPARNKPIDPKMQILFSEKIKKDYELER